MQCLYTITLLCLSAQKAKPGISLDKEYVAYYMQPEVSYITGTYIHTYIHKKIIISGDKTHHSHN